MTGMNTFSPPGSIVDGSGTTGAGARVHADGALFTSGAASSSLNITASTVVKATPGRVMRVVVMVTAAAASSINDCITTGAVAAANALLNIPASTAVGTVYNIDWPCANGITVAPGASVTLAISYT